MLQNRQQEIQNELNRLNIKNDPLPSCCPNCKGQLEKRTGMVGEAILICTNKSCSRFIVWEDHEQAISIVF